MELFKSIFIKHKDFISISRDILCSQNKYYVQEENDRFKLIVIS